MLLLSSVNTDSGASLQLRDFGPAFKYSSTEDFAPSSPCYCILCSSWASGHAGETGIRQRHGSCAPNYHRKSKGEITI